VRKEDIIREYALSVLAQFLKDRGCARHAATFMVYLAQNIEDVPPAIQSAIYEIERFAGLTPLIQQLQELEPPQDEYEC